MDDKDQPPASVSNQNREQSHPGHSEGAGGQREDAPDKARGERRRSGGESGEGSQSTGDPNSAG